MVAIGTVTTNPVRGGGLDHVAGYDAVRQQRGRSRDTRAEARAVAVKPRSATALTSGYSRVPTVSHAADRAWLPQNTPMVKGHCDLAAPWQWRVNDE